jgi:hypothetical protein
MVTNGSAQLPQTLPPMRRIVRGLAMIQGLSFNQQTLVIPAKAGALNGDSIYLIAQVRANGGRNVGLNIYCPHLMPLTELAL